MKPIEVNLNFPDAEKIKNHFERHKTAYLVGAGITFAGITCLIMRKNVVSHLDAGANGPSPVTTHSFSFNFFSKRSGIIVTTIHNGSRGHPGFRVRNLDHMLDFDTQGAAARAFEIPETIVSKHLNGKISNAYGFHFERIAV